MCAISINSYNGDWSESEGKRPKPTPLLHMRLWFVILSEIRNFGQDETMFQNPFDLTFSPYGKFYFSKEI